MAQTPPPDIPPTTALHIDLLCKELDTFFHQWRKSGQKVTDSPWVIVTRATVAAEKLKLSPEVEKRVVTEAALRTLKKLAGEEEATAMDADLLADQIPAIYNTFKPACNVVIEETKFGINRDQPSPPPPAVKETGDVPGLPVLSGLIEFTDTVMAKFMTADSGNEGAKPSVKKSKSKSFKGAGRAKYFASVASLIAYACSFAEKQLRKAGADPKVVNLLEKISTVATAMVMIVPMAMTLPPVLAWIAGVAALLVVVIAVALSPDSVPQHTA